MRLRHDAILRVTNKSGTQVLDTSEVEARLLDAHLAVSSIMYNRLSMSGGVAWWNPSTGEAISRPKASIEVLSGELVGDELCYCEECVHA